MPPLPKANDSQTPSTMPPSVTSAVSSIIAFHSQKAREAAYGGSDGVCTGVCCQQGI